MRGKYRTLSCVHRSPWGDFPDVIVQTNMTKLQGHPAYRGAKEGDVVAAFHVVESVRKPAKGRQPREFRQIQRVDALRAGLHRALQREQVVDFPATQAAPGRFRGRLEPLGCREGDH
jgi:hypothetical protein